MKNKILLLTFFALSVFANIGKSQSFEGYIADNLPVWMDINSPISNGPVTGAYFYKKTGGSIPLTGTANGNKIILNEKNKSGAIVGIFTLINYQDSIIGNWKKPNTTKLLSVKLYKVDPSYKTYAKIPKSDKLILAKGNTLNDAMNELAGETGNAPKLNYTFAEKNILSTNFVWEAAGAYISSGTVYHTFDLTNNSEIFLSMEIDPNQMPKLKEKLRLQLQKELDNYRKIYTETEWVNIFMDEETFKNAFILSETPETIFDNYFIKKGYVQIVIDNYFGFPHVSQAMDFSTIIKIPFSEFVLYLNDNSILKNLK